MHDLSSESFNSGETAGIYQMDQNLEEISPAKKLKIEDNSNIQEQSMITAADNTNILPPKITPPQDLHLINESPDIKILSELAKINVLNSMYKNNQLIEQQLMASLNPLNPLFNQIIHPNLMNSYNNPYQLNNFTRLNQPLWNQNLLLNQNFQANQSLMLQNPFLSQQLALQYSLMQQNSPLNLPSLMNLTADNSAQLLNQQALNSLTSNLNQFQQKKG